MRSPDPTPFEVKDCALITLALGRTAQTLRELRDRVAEVPLGSLRHHMLESKLRPSFDDPELPNDFALWALDALRDLELAERLSAIDAALLAEGETLRQRLLDVLEDRLAEEPRLDAARPGHEFHFLRSQLVVYPTDQAAGDPRALAELLPRFSLGGVYLHFVESRLRPPRGEDDFSTWLDDWGETGQALRERLATVDPMFGSLRELRSRIAAAVDGNGAAR